MGQSNAGVRLVRCVVVAGCLLLPVGAGAQAADDRPQFEVASVRQNRSETPAESNFPLNNGNVYVAAKPGDDAQANAGYLSAVNQPMWRYIAFAYKLSGTQELALRFNMFAGLTGTKLPKWVTGDFSSGADRFDITARAAGRPTKDEMRLMMQRLLEDRFGLQAHFETREAPVYAMVLAKPGRLGAGLKPHRPEESCDGSTATPPANGVAVCGVLGRLPASEPGMFRIGARGISLELLASSLPAQTGLATLSKPVVDRTGLTGLYDVTLEWAGLLNGAPNPAGPAFDEALRDQLGLKLESGKGAVQILVVDRIDRPSEN